MNAEYTDTLWGKVKTYGGFGKYEPTEGEYYHKAHPMCASNVSVWEPAGGISYEMMYDDNGLPKGNTAITGDTHCLYCNRRNRRDEYECAGCGAPT